MLVARKVLVPRGEVAGYLSYLSLEGFAKCVTQV